MNKLVIILLLICSVSFAKEPEQAVEQILTPVQVLTLFEEQNPIDISTLPDLVDKEEKVSACMEEYIKKQSRSYSRIAQNNLYDLIHNFERITSMIAGKKTSRDTIPQEEKLEVLARLQCEAYYTIGVLK
jgi:hypothetical protein